MPAPADLVIVNAKVRLLGSSRRRATAVREDEIHRMRDLGGVRPERGMLPA